MEWSDFSTSDLVNLSSVELTEAGVRTLSGGLSFCPGTGGSSKFHLLKALDHFACNMRLRELFYEHPNADKACFLPSSKHLTPPPQRDTGLDLCIKAGQHDVLEADKKQMPFRPNLLIKEKEALQNVAFRQEVEIKPADKGGAIEMITSEADRQLPDTSFLITLMNIKKLSKETSKHN